MENYKEQLLSRALDFYEDGDISEKVHDQLRQTIIHEENPNKRFYILILRELGYGSLERNINKELISLQNDGNVIIDVDIKPDTSGDSNMYLGLIKYSYDMKY